MDMPKPSWDLQEQVLVKRHYNPIIIIIIIIIIIVIFNSMSVYCRPDVTKNNAGKTQNTIHNSTGIYKV